MQQGLRYAQADEAAHRVDLGDDDRDLDAVMRAALGRIRLGVAGEFLGQQAQVPRRRLADAGAIDVEPQLEAALDQDDRDIGEAEQQYRRQMAIADRVIDDAPLQLERRQGQQEDQDGDDREPELITTGPPPAIGP